MKKTPDSSN